MILSEKVSIYRIISGTWKHFLLNVSACIVAYLLFKFFSIPDFEIPVLIPTILGTALAFFIGFNNNQAYDRWWEARKIWGALVNNSRTWARLIVHFPDYNIDTEEVQLKAKTFVYRHISFLYALKQVLRNSNDEEYKTYISDEDMAYIESESNKANALLTLQTRDLNDLYASNAIDGFKFLELNKTLDNFCSEMGKSERISNTVFPTTYNYYTRIFIWVFIVFVTLVTAQSIGIWSILAGTLLGFVFLTTHNIGRSLLNPFEEISTGIPLNQITRTIEINMLQTLKVKEIPKPVESIKGEYIM
jgi:putative membrane protein